MQLQSAGSRTLWETKLCTKNNMLQSLTDTGGDVSTPHLAVLAGCSFLALKTVPRGAEELAARVEVGAVRALVSTIYRHIELWTADLCHRKCSRDGVLDVSSGMFCTVCFVSFSSDMCYIGY